MRKKGFTLIELMGVLILLGLLSLIIIPLISNILKDQKEKQYAQQITNIELMAKNFGSDNLSILPSQDGEIMYINLAQLKSMGYMEKNIINPITENEISNCARIKITKSGNNHHYEYDQDSENETSCNEANDNVIISAPVTKYIKKNGITSYIVTINENNSENLINKYEIDRTKIRLVGDTDSIYNVIEGNGIYKIVIRGGNQEGEIGLRLESKAILRNETEDIIGTAGLVASDTIVVDNTDPVITFGTNGNSNWSKNASSTITVSDELSKGDTKTYKYVYSTSINTTPSTSFTSGSSYSETKRTGDYYLIASACDKAGNCTTTNSNVFKLDNTGPTITFETDVNGGWSQAVNARITVTDEHSKGDTQTYKYIYSTSIGETPNTSFTSGFVYPMLGTGEYYLIASACDNAGNCTTTNSDVFKLDYTKPTISSAIANACSNNKRTITVKGSDLNSGISGYLITDSTSTPSLSSFISSTVTSWTSEAYSSGTYYAWVKDAAGNISAYTTVSVGTCDNIGPTITFGTNGSSGSWVAQASTTVTATDDNGISSINYGWSTSDSSTSLGSSTTSGSLLSSKCDRTTDGECYLYVKACDTQGNCSTDRTNAFKLDVTAPTITINEYDACSGGFYEKYTLSDSGSGIKQYGKIHCDVNSGADHCYGLITGSRIKEIDVTASQTFNSEWTVCNTSGDEQPEGTYNVAFWVKTFDAVGNMSKMRSSNSPKAFSKDTACPSGCSR